MIRVKEFLVPIFAESGTDAISSSRTQLLRATRLLSNETVIVIKDRRPRGSYIIAVIVVVLLIVFWTTLVGVFMWCLMRRNHRRAVIVIPTRAAYTIIEESTSIQDAPFPVEIASMKPETDKSDDL